MSDNHIISAEEARELEEALHHAVKGHRLDISHGALLADEVIRQRARAEAAEKQVESLTKALRRLTLMARTGGGSAGRDPRLMLACADAEALLSPTEAPTHG